MLEGSFRRVYIGADATFMPFGRARVTRGGHTSVEVDVLLDTGASCNLISIDSASTLLGMTADDVRGGKPLRISAVGQPEVRAFGWQVDVELRGTTQSENTEVFRGVWLYVADGGLPVAPFLLGQLTGLQGRAFIHLNQVAKRRWLLRR